MPEPDQAAQHPVTARPDGKDASPHSLRAVLGDLAREAGFSRLGVARAHPRPDDLQRLKAWLAAGHHGTMAWLERDPERRSDPARVLAGARSVLVLALDYDCEAERSVAFLGRDGESAPEGHGWISRYALGDDYHHVIERRLAALTAAIAREVGPRLGEGFRGPEAQSGPFDPRRDLRGTVDYGPVLERRWAEEAGLGWQGKHSLLVHPQHGSYFFLATLLTTLEVAPDAPTLDHCGSCSRCIDVCPTAAIVAPKVVDSRRCISALTIETKGSLSEEQALLVGDHVFGCDLCQDVCPFNRFSRPAEEPELAPRPGSVGPRLADLLALDEAGFAARFAGSPLQRTKLAGVQRNALAVQANQRRRAPAPGGMDGGADEAETAP